MYKTLKTCDKSQDSRSMTGSDEWCATYFFPSIFLIMKGRSLLLCLGEMVLLYIACKFQKMPKRPKEFSIEYDCFICQDDIKDPITKYRKNLPLLGVDGAEIEAEYNLWKKKLSYPAKGR